MCPPSARPCRSHPIYCVSPTQGPRPYRGTKRQQKSIPFPRSPPSQTSCTRHWQSWFSHVLGDHHLLQECSVPSGRKVRVVGVRGIALRLLQCNEFEASLLEQFEKSRQHDSFKHTDVQEHHMLDVVPTDLVRYSLSDGKGFGRSTQMALLQPVNRLHIVLRKAPRVRLVVGIVAKVERHLGHLVLVLFEKCIDSVMLFRRVSLAQKWESQPMPEP